MKKDSKINKKYIIVGVVIAVIALYFIFGGASTNAGTHVVARGDVSQSTVLSGTVKTTDKADLGFAASGRVARITVANNQRVFRGQMLAQLEVEDLAADLKIKQANLRTSDVDLNAAKNELNRVKQQEEVKVESAYRKLLSLDLKLIPESNTYSVDAPTISGFYNSTIEGEYKIVIDKENITLPDVTLRTFGLERSERVIDENAPTLLGTKGLYISFPNSVDTDSYNNTIWYLGIPNKSGSSYLANYNAYNEAQKARDLVVENAEFKYEKLLTEGDNGNSSVAQAEIQKINAEIKKNTIYAPFKGKVTNIGKEVGESAGVGERVVSVLGEGTLEVVLQVSELDVSKIIENTPIEITLDAFPGEIFPGILKTVNSRDTEVDGVPVYEAFVEMSADSRLKTGMSAKGKIVFATKNNVLNIPSYTVENLNGVNTVQVLSSTNKKETRVVTLGLLGSDSMVEVTSGLSEGEHVVSQK